MALPKLKKLIATFVTVSLATALFVNGCGTVKSEPNPTKPPAKTVEKTVEKEVNSNFVLLGKPFRNDRDELQFAKGEPPNNQELNRVYLRSVLFAFMFTKGNSVVTESDVTYFMEQSKLPREEVIDVIRTYDKLTPEELKELVPYANGKKPKIEVKLS